MDRTNNGLSQQANFRTRLSPVDSYHGPYMHEIESMKRARDYLLWWCRRSKKPVWNKINISTTVNTGTENDGFGEASSKFSYADIPNHNIDESVPSVDVPYDNIVENEDNVQRAPNSGGKIVRDETKVSHESLPAMPDYMPTIQRENCSSNQVVSPSCLRPCTPNFNNNISRAMQDNKQRINSSGQDYGACIKELNANITTTGYNDFRARNIGTTYFKSPESFQRHTYVHETNDNSESANFAVAPSNSSRNKRSHDSAFGSTQWQTNLNESCYNDNHFSHVETMSYGYCKKTRLYNSTFYNKSKSQTNLNYLYGHNNNVSYEESPPPVSYHSRGFFNYV